MKIYLFEISKTDLAGRIGKIKTNHGEIETPAYVPVIHPVKQTIRSKKIKEIGFELVITNAYITRNNYGDKAIEKGIHSIIDYDKGINELPLAKKIARSSLSGNKLPSSSVKVAFLLKYSSLSIK